VNRGWRCASGVFQAGFWFGGFFNLHVTKLFGVKDLATILAFDKLAVFMPGNDAYPRVFAGCCHRSWYRWEKVLFPPDCIGIFAHLETISVEFLNSFAIFSGRKKKFIPGLVIPTEMVVY
jgi:hypothetical protein